MTPSTECRGYASAWTCKCIEYMCELFPFFKSVSLLIFPPRWTNLAVLLYCYCFAVYGILKFDWKYCSMYCSFRKYCSIYCTSGKYCSRSILQLPYYTTVCSAGLWNENTGMQYYFSKACDRLCIMHTIAVGILDAYFGTSTAALYHTPNPSA